MCFSWYIGLFVVQWAFCGILGFSWYIGLFVVHWAFRGTLGFSWYIKLFAKRQGFPHVSRIHNYFHLCTLYTRSMCFHLENECKLWTNSTVSLLSTIFAYPRCRVENVFLISHQTINSCMHCVKISYQYRSQSELVSKSIV